MTAEQGDMDAVIETAADWFARKRSGKLTAEELLALRAWLDESPEHAGAWREIARGWDLAGAVRSEPEMLEVRESARRARPMRRPLAAIAASLAVVVLGGWAAVASGLMPSPLDIAQGQQTFRTGVGQTATVRLRDGSVVTLDTDTVLRARETRDRRILRLEKGQAFFKVAKDKARPFTVAAGGKLVTATGTAFTVRLDRKAVEVTLVEGRVRVEETQRPVTTPAKQATAAEMKAGSRLVAAQDHDWSLDPVDTGKATSWMEGRLIFEDRPLAEAAAELNRYSDKKIIVRDPAIAGAKVVSVVRAGDVDGFVRVVTAAGFARVASNSDEAVELVRPEEKTAQRPAGEVHDF